MQNVVLRTILEAFQTSSILFIKTLTNILLINILLDQKNQKLKLKMLKMSKNHSIRFKVSKLWIENKTETICWMNNKRDFLNKMKTTFMQRNRFKFYVQSQTLSRMNIWSRNLHQSKIFKRLLILISKLINVWILQKNILKKWKTLLRH